MELKMSSRVLSFFIHGTSAPTIEFLEEAVKCITSIFTSDLHTSSASNELIPLDLAPEASKNFNSLLEQYTVEQDRFYFQWSGNLGESSWLKAANYLIERIDEITDEEEDVDVIFIGHSHGGNVARLVAEHYAEGENKKFKFHCITIGMPLSKDPAIVMPANVPTWQHFYCQYDMIQGMGSLLWQRLSYSFFDVVRRIEDVYQHYKIQNSVDAPVPEGWRSYMIPDDTYLKGHNDAVRASSATFITEHVQAIFSKNLGNTDQFSDSDIYKVK